MTGFSSGRMMRDEKLPRRGAVDASRLQWVSRQAGQASEQHQYVERQCHP